MFVFFWNYYKFHFPICVIYFQVSTHFQYSLKVQRFLAAKKSYVSTYLDSYFSVEAL
jgi:hypothetical protein